MSEKIRVALLFGGRSCEHEVSVTSARSVYEAIDREQYDVTLVGISREGRWLVGEQGRALLESPVVTESPGRSSMMLDYVSGGRLVPREAVESSVMSQEFDVVFPLLHGPYGEDGTVQGLLELASMAYVGSGVVGSAVGMDKQMMRRAFTAEGLPQTGYMVVRRHRWRSGADAVVNEVLESLSFPLFVKPVNLGSSVGVSKAHDEQSLRRAIDLAGRFDTRIMVEASVEDAHEVECAVLGNDDPQASVLGEIIPGAEFYDYQTKYIDDHSKLVIPAELPEDVTDEVRRLAVKAFTAVEAAGLARVDFFVRRNDHSVLINEVNTMPGFTPISMYPKLWQATGLSYSELIDRLIQLALERHRDRGDIETSL